MSKQMLSRLLRPAAAIATAAAALTLTACATTSTGPVARADLKPTAGSTAGGWVEFAQVGDKVRVTAEVTGLKPNTTVGFHVHDKGDCSAPDGMSAGGHFNPGGKPHGHYGQPERHGGDMPALQSDAGGKAVVDWTADLITVTPGAFSVVGRAVIVHAAPDDYKTQPTGNAGARVACGVIALR